MKAMKGLSMNKMLGSIKRKTGAGAGAGPASPEASSASAATPADNPEVTAHNSVKAFCESGGSAQNDEVLFLPPIVDAAESSPAAAAECARGIRKYLSKDYFSRPSWQYNALMLVRILTDNPGETFTRNIDDKFVDTARHLLKNSKDPSVRQLLMETLDDFERTKLHDENLAPLILMWNKEKEKAFKDTGARAPPIGPRPSAGSPGPQSNGNAQNYFAKSHSNNRLPNAVELASRLEEARTSAKLLEQVVMNTPPAEMLQNDLIREFANRCLSASRSIQGYMVSESPAPDNDTMENLIDTNEQLQTALNQHQRAMLSARKQLGLGAAADDSPPAAPLSDGSDRAWNQQVPAAAAAAAIPATTMPTMPTMPTTTTTTASGGLGLFASGGNGKGKQAEVYAPPSGPPPGQASGSGSGSGSSSGSGSGRGGWREGEPAAADPFEDPFAERRAAGGGGGKESVAGAHQPPQPSFLPALSTGGVDRRPVWEPAPMAAPTVPPPPPPPPAPGRLRSDGSDDDLYGATPKSKRSISRF